MESFTFKSAIRGYHVYKDIWTPSVDDKLSVKREFKNRFNRFAVKIILDGETVGISLHVEESLPWPSKVQDAEVNSPSVEWRSLVW